MKAKISLDFSSKLASCSKRCLFSVATIALSRPALKVRADGGKSTVGFAFPKGSGLRANGVYASVRFNGLRAVSPQLIAGRADAPGARSQLGFIL